MSIILTLCLTKSDLRKLSHPSILKKLKDETGIEEITGPKTLVKAARKAGIPAKRARKTSK